MKRMDYMMFSIKALLLAVILMFLITALQLVAKYFTQLFIDRGGKEECHGKGNNLRTVISTIIHSATLGLGTYAFAMFICTMLAILIPSSATEHGAVIGQKIPQGMIPGAVFLICILAPLGEEILFRGMILPNLLEHFTPRVSVFLQTMVFAAIHSGTTQSAYAFAAGILLGWFAVKYGSPIPGIIAHAVFNSTSLIIYYCPGAAMVKAALLAVFAAMGICAVTKMCMMENGDLKSRRLFIGFQNMRKPPRTGK